MAFATSVRPKRIVWVCREPDRPHIRRGFTAKGIVEGRDIELVFAEGEKYHDIEEGEAVAEDLLRRKPDIMVMTAGHLLLALHRRVRDVPIVFYNLTHDPARLGLVGSLRRPGANITGTTTDLEPVRARAWQHLKQMAPGTRRGGRLVEREFMAQAEQEKERSPLLREAMRADAEVNRAIAAQLGIEIVDVLVPRGSSADEMVAATRAARAHAVDATLAAFTPEVARALRVAGIPSITYSFAGARNGMLLGYTYEWDEGRDHAVAIVQRILRGESPATIPVYKTQTYAIAINRTTARTLGMEIPASLLIEAKVFD